MRVWPCVVSPTALPFPELLPQPSPLQAHTHHAPVTVAAPARGRPGLAGRRRAIAVYTAEIQLTGGWQTRGRGGWDVPTWRCMRGRQRQSVTAASSVRACVGWGGVRAGGELGESGKPQRRWSHVRAARCGGEGGGLTCGGGDWPFSPHPNQDGRLRPSWLSSLAPRKRQQWGACTAAMKSARKN